MNKKIKIFSYIRLAIYTAAIIAAVMLVSGKITTNCYWNETYGVLCPTCGMTRATISILKLNFTEAVQYHAVYTCILFPLTIGLIINDVYTIIWRAILKNKKLSITEKICGLNGSKNGKYIALIFIFAIVFLVYAILRNFI